MTTSPDAPNQLTSHKYAEFVEALELLYIKDNISGRNKFTANWPDAALLIFSEELIHYDREGVADRERRSIVEQEAEERRLALLEKISAVEERSVNTGALQVDYVQGM